MLQFVPFVQYVQNVWGLLGLTTPGVSLRGRALGLCPEPPIGRRLGHSASIPACAAEWNRKVA
jgi:hypothetical protein